MYMLVRKINGLETAGSLSILFSDKTGTITEGKLSVVELAAGNGTVFQSLDQMPDSLAADVVTGIGVNNSASASGGSIIGGNSTDRALMAFLNAAGRTVSKEGVKSFSAFDSNKKRSSVVVERDGKCETFVKGAPERIIEECAYYIDETGQRQALTGKQALTSTFSP